MWSVFYFGELSLRMSPPTWATAADRPSRKILCLPINSPYLLFLRQLFVGVWILKESNFFLQASPWKPRTIAIYCENFVCTSLRRWPSPSDWIFCDASLRECKILTNHLIIIIYRKFGIILITSNISIWLETDPVIRRKGFNMSRFLQTAMEVDPVMAPRSGLLEL